MKILAVDSTDKTASVAIMEDQRLIGEYYINTNFTHSQTLMPMIISIMESTKLKPKDIDLYAICNGPGSFTGIRIGIATIKGMAMPENKDCIAVSSLEAMAYNFTMQNCLVCATLDARRECVYNAIFRVNNGVCNRLCEDRLISVEELSKIIFDKYARENIILVGNGSNMCYNSVDRLGVRLNIASEQNRYIRAGAVARLAYDLFSKGEVIKATNLKPFYLRKSQAERNLENSNNSNK